MPRISVLMPVYNTAEEYLKEAIESILNQTFSDFEFLIINDGSTTNVKEIILSYNDNRIKYVENEKNLGLIKTLNKGLELAQGEFIARMDSDDISLPQRFEKQVEFLDKNPEISVLGTWFKYIPSERIVKTFENDKDIKECMLVNSNNIGHPSVMFRRSIVTEFEAKYDENQIYVEDYALWLSLLDKVKFANLPEVLLNYRVLKSGICGANVEIQNLNSERLMVSAQGKFFEIDNTEILKIVEKLKKKQVIDAEELLEINEFSKRVKEKMQERQFKCNYDVNKNFYRHAVKHCKKSPMFLKIVWTGELNKLLNLKLGFKIFNSIRFERYSKKIKPEFDANNPKISAVMALYNTPYCYLKKTVKSILNQSFENFELIIIDDASTTNYKEFFEKFNDKRVKYFKLEKNAGPGHARNEGIKKALGEYVAIVDSDDIYMPKRFERQEEFLDKNPEISILGGAFRPSNKIKATPVIENDNDIKKSLLFNSALPNPLIMLRKKDFIEKNLFYPEDINFAEDYCLWIDAMFSGIKMANLKDVLMIYTRRKQQLSKTKKVNQKEILKKIYKRLLTKLSMNPSEKELELHYNIDASACNEIESEEKIANWFDQIIEHNKNARVFEEELILQKKNDSIKDYKRCKNRLFKIKLFCYNVCIDKSFKIYLQKR